MVPRGPSQLGRPAASAGVTRVRTNARAAASAEIARRLMFTPPELLW